MVPSGEHAPTLVPVLLVNLIGALGFSIVLPFLVFTPRVTWGGRFAMAIVAGPQGTVQGVAGSVSSVASIVGLLVGGVVFGLVGGAVFGIAGAIMSVAAVLSFRLGGLGRQLSSEPSAPA